MEEETQREGEDPASDTADGTHPEDCDGIGVGYTEFTIEASVDNTGDSEADIDRDCTKHTSKVLLVSKMEERVHFPRCPFILLEFAVVERNRGGVLSKEDSAPENKRTEPSSPKRITLSHMRLEETSNMRTIA